MTVQPGLVLAELNRELFSHDRMFGPDPVTRSVTTIGGVLSMNSSGSHWIKYGEPRGKVVSLDIVTANGELVQINSPRNVSGRLGPDSTSSASIQPMRSVARDFEQRIGKIVRGNAELIQQHRPSTQVNQAGYNVFDLVRDSTLDLTRLFVGSEGTLGIITQATLLTEPIPRHRGVALLFFHRLESAAIAAVEISKMGVVACDMMDRRLLSFAREMRSGIHPADSGRSGSDVAG